MKQHIQLVVAKHLRHQLDIHVRNVDLLQAAVQDGDGLVELLDVGDDAREELGLLVFVGAFLVVRC